MKNNHNKKTMANNINLKALWLAGGITLTLFSIGVIIFATTNAYCRGGEAMCASKNWGAYIGIFLGILAIFLSFLKDRITIIKKKKAHNQKRGRGLVYFGLTLILIGIIFAIIGLNNKFLNPSGAAMTPGAAMTIISVPLTVAGATIVGFGAYASKKDKVFNSALWPILTSIYVIGIIAMVFLIFF